MLTNSVESLQSSVSDKIDRGIAELIVQKKYEDIVQYLQDALAATGEDEDNFKNMAIELDEKMKKLASSKSDRLEIQPIQDSLVKVEASIAKLMGDKKDSRRENDYYSKAEMEEMLFGKVDKNSLEEIVNNVIKSRRGKATRMASNSNIGPSSTQFINENSGGSDNRSNQNNNNQMQMSQSMPNFRPGNSQYRNQQQAALHMANVSDNVDVPTPHPNESIAGKHRPNMDGNQLRMPKGGFPTTQPGKFRHGSEHGIPGGSSEIMQQQEMERTGNYSYDNPSAFDQSGYHSAYGGPPKGPPRVTMPPSQKGSGVSNTGVVPGRGLQPEGVPRGVFPPINMPGRNVIPTTDQRGGGSTKGGYVNAYYTDEDAVESFDYIGGATKGGGFNSRSPTKILSDPTALSTSLSEIQAKQEASHGKVAIVGQDGHFYQSDEEVPDDEKERKGSILDPQVTTVEVNPIVPVSEPENFVVSN